MKMGGEKAVSHMYHDIIVKKLKAMCQNAGG